MFTDAEKAQIRRYMGGSPVGASLGPDQQLEAAIASVEALGDGGASETFAKDLLTQLAALETQITAALQNAEAASVDQVRVDFLRARAGLRAEGRRLSLDLANILNYTPDKRRMSF